MSSTLTAESIITIDVISIGLIVFIDGGDRIVYKDDPQILQGMIKDPNEGTDYNVGIDTYNITWTCSDVNGSSCLDRYNRTMNNFSSNIQLIIPE